MKVLHVIHSVDPRSGGPSHALREMVRAQLVAGHHISIVATTTQSAEPWADADEYTRRMTTDPAFAGAELTLLPAYGRRRPWSRWAYTPRARAELSARLRDVARRPNVVHIHGTFSHLTLVAGQMARRHKVPYVLRPAGSLNALCLAQGARYLKNGFIRFLLNRELKQAAMIQATSDSEARELAVFVSSDRVVVVPHGVDVPAPATQANVFLHKYPQLHGKRRVLFLSRLHPKKRAGLLVEALALVRDKWPDAVLVLAGSDAGDMENVRQLAAGAQLADRVFFCGFLEGAMKTDAFRAADVFALPSIDENFGVAVVEAMAHGAPILVTAGVATHVHVDASGCGVTVDGTPEAVAEGLVRLLECDRDALGGRGREYVSEHLAWPAIVRRLDDMYRECPWALSPERSAVSVR